MLIVFNSLQLSPALHLDQQQQCAQHNSGGGARSSSVAERHQQRRQAGDGGSAPPAPGCDGAGYLLGPSNWKSPATKKEGRKTYSRWWQQRWRGQHGPVCMVGHRTCAGCARRHAPTPAAHLTPPISRPPEVPHHTLINKPTEVLHEKQEKKRKNCTLLTLQEFIYKEPPRLLHLQPLVVPLVPPCRVGQVAHHGGRADICVVRGGGWGGLALGRGARSCHWAAAGQTAVGTQHSHQGGGEGCNVCQPEAPVCPCWRPSAAEEGGRAGQCTTSGGALARHQRSNLHDH